MTVQDTPLPDRERTTVPRAAGTCAGRGLCFFVPEPLGDETHAARARGLPRPHLGGARAGVARLERREGGAAPPRPSFPQVQGPPGLRGQGPPRSRDLPPR